MAEADEKDTGLLCSECFAEIGGGACGDHPDDPPLDPTRPEVQDMLADMDAQALTSLQRKFMSLGAIPGALTAFGMVALTAAMDFPLPRLVVGGSVAIVTLAGVTYGRRRANRRFKPRFARWTGRDYEMGEDIEELLEESRDPETT